MRCLACNVALTDFEATRKTLSGHYVDLCNKCFYSGVNEDITTIENPDLEMEGNLIDFGEHTPS